MSRASDAWQYAVLAFIVLASILQVLRKLAPRLSMRSQALISAALNRPGRSSAARWIGRRLQPQVPSGSCGNGCGTCGTCGAPSQESGVHLSQKQAHPVAFHQVSKRDAGLIRKR